MCIGQDKYPHKPGKKKLLQSAGFSQILRIIIVTCNNIPTISRNTQSKSYMLSLTECVWEFQNNALWDTHKYAPHNMETAMNTLVLPLPSLDHSPVDL